MSSNKDSNNREQLMAILWRTSALAHRHAEIGGELEDWNGMGTAWFYDHTPERAKADYEAIRTKAGSDGCVRAEEGSPGWSTRRRRHRPRDDTQCRKDHARSFHLCMHPELRRQVHRRLHHLSPRRQSLDGCARHRHRDGADDSCRRCGQERRCDLLTMICMICRCKGPLSLSISLPKHIDGIRDLSLFRHHANASCLVVP